MNPNARKAQEARLRAIETQLRAKPGSLDLRYERALALDRLGRREAAQQVYDDVLKRDPQHFGARNNRALLLWNAGDREGGFLGYVELARRHPENAIARANLGHLYARAGDRDLARAEYAAALRADPAHAEAKRGLASLLAQGGDAAGAARVEVTSTVSLPYRGEGSPVRALVLVTLGAGNLGVERLIDDRVVAATKLTVELHGDAPLPPHDVVFNAIGDPDEASAALERARALLAADTAPVINPPEHVLTSGRVANARRFAALHDVVAPRAAAFARGALAAADGAATLAAAGFTFPLLLRSPGFHTGKNFERVETAAALGAIAAALPGDVLLAIAFADTSVGGEYRKYRAMFVGGEVLPLHLAISADWKVHYFSADMTERADHRAIEAAYLADLPGALGPRAAAALARIAATLGLDYGGIDFTLDAAGSVVVFEANATMVVVPPGADERWDYKRAPVERILTAARGLIPARAGRVVL